MEKSLEALRDHLLGAQAAGGYWCGELECDSTPSADFILLWHFLRRNQESHEAIAQDPKIIKAARHILKGQNRDGGWPIFHGGPGEISATLKAYFALKLAGYAAENPSLRRAAQFVQEHGGIIRTNSFMKFYLALFGQWPWSKVPAMPPELFLLPLSFPFNIYAMSSWSRAILVPLFILYATKPRVSISPAMGIGELLAAQGQGVSKPAAKKDAWSRFFYCVDFLLKLLEKIPWKPWRKKALLAARDWIVQRLPQGQGLGSIWPAMINAQMALSVMDFPRKGNLLDESLREINALVLEEAELLRIAPCFSPVWDTAIAIIALRAAGVKSDDPRLLEAGEWILKKEVRAAWDWQKANPAGRPGGWYFQFANECYPDTDDTAMVLLALDTLKMGPRKDAAVRRALDWLLSMQNDDGGWGAFDKNNNREFLTKMPFADHNAMIDPSSCDVTGRVLEAFGVLGKVFPQAAERAFAYLAAKQEDDGIWFGRWGVNYIYGTWAVSNALRAWQGTRTGLDLSGALAWLRQRQNPDGGWGESPASYDDPTLRGQGSSTASQTAWALLTFFNAGVFEDPAVQKGIAYLTGKIASAPVVEEPEFTATGFPRVFYLNYHLYRVSFPLMALSRYRDHCMERVSCRLTG